MTSNQDILAFLRADREERAREKEEEKEARAKERAEDMKKIEEMIIHGVKEEVKSVLQPVHDRIERQEKVVEDITRKFSFIMREVAALRSPVGNHIEKSSHGHHHQETAEEYPGGDQHRGKVGGIADLHENDRSQA